MTLDVISLTGGGLRGIGSAILLSRIESERPGTVTGAGLYAGTSTGSAIAAALASERVVPHDLASIYTDHAADIFSRRDIFDRITHLDEIVRADYSSIELRRVLHEKLGDLKLGDLRKLFVAVAVDLDNDSDCPDLPRRWKAKVHHNFPRTSADADVLLVDAVMRSSAAPIYFPSYQGFVDGGLCANNPSVCAISAAIRQGYRLSDLRMLSVGTGFNPQFIEGDRHDWGYKQWATKLIPLIFDLNVGIFDRIAGDILNGNYHNLDFALTEEIGLDDVSAIPRIEEIANQVDIGPTLEWLDHVKWGEDQ